MSPWSQALLVCFCFSVEGRQKVNPSRGAGAAPSQGSSCRAGSAPRTAQPAALDSGQPHRAAHTTRPARSWGQPFHRVPKATLGLGTPTLVLQGLQPLLGLVVQLLQVRGPRAGEEDVVGTFLARRVLHAQPLLALALGSACGDSGVSWAGGTWPRCHQCVPTHRGQAPGGDGHPRMTLSRSAPNQVLETPREIPSRGSARPVDIPESGCLHWFSPHHPSGAGMWDHPPSPAPSLGANEVVNCAGLREKGQHRGGLNVDGTTMTFPSERCVIPRPCSSLQEQGLPPCPGRLGTAQTRETEAHPAAEIPKDPNPFSEPRWMLNTPSATPGAARSPHSLHPAVPTARGCPGITQPCPHPARALQHHWHSPACSCLSKASNSSCSEKKKQF